MIMTILRLINKVLPYSLAAVLYAMYFTGPPSLALPDFFNRVTVTPSDYKLRLSWYDPALGGINCDSDCSTMASGDKTASWVGGKNGVFAAACPREWGWQTGTRFQVMGMNFECRDTGGWIACYEPGEYDPALKTNATEPYCWIDAMTPRQLAGYGEFTSDWGFITQSTAGFGMPQAVSLLYTGSKPRMTQGWHPSAGLPDAQDWSAGCGTPLKSPVPGNALVTYNGDDGLNIGNTMITIAGDGGKATLLHGRFIVPVGTEVIGGITTIGYEDSNGKSTGCHSHVIVYP